MNPSPTLASGAANAIHTCLKVSPQDRVIILTDESTAHIGRALLEQSEGAGATSRLLTLEEYGPRPLTDLPLPLKELLADARPSVTIYAASAQPGEVKFRIPLLNFLTQELKVRHGHMVGIDERLMVQGMAADYHQIARITQRVYDKVRKAGTIMVTSAKGSSITATFDPNLRWKPCTGIIERQGDWSNLPEGEVFTCPASLEGIIVADLVGDYFTHKYGLLERPVAIRVRDSLVTEVQSPNRALGDELEAYLFQNRNGNRAGEFAIGTNIGLTQLTGNLLQDEKIPGVHIAFGNPYPHETGADWDADVHVDVIPTGCTIWVDKEVIMRQGQFSAELLRD